MENHKPTISYQNFSILKDIFIMPVYIFIADFFLKFMLTNISCETNFFKKITLSMSCLYDIDIDFIGHIVLKNLHIFYIVA